MIRTLPAKYAVIITKRYLRGVAQAPDVEVVGLPADITYDYLSMEHGSLAVGNGVTPSSRIVSTLGSQVEIQAALEGDEATLHVLADGERRLFVRESIVFGDCNQPLT